MAVVPNSALAPVFGEFSSAQQTPTPATATSAQHTTPVVAAPAEDTSTPAAEKFWVSNPGYMTKTRKAS